MLTQHDLATTTAHTRPLSVRLSRSEGSLLSNATPQGEVSVDWVGPVVRTCRPSGMLRQAAWLQRRLVGVQGFYGQPGTGLLPWSNLWELSGPYAQSGGYRGMVGGADTTQFWLTRLVTQVESYRQGVVVHSSSVGLAGGMPVSAPYSHPLVLLLGRVLAGSGDFGVEPTGA